MQRLSANAVAIVLAGGNGTRIGPLGSVLPKCLLAVSRHETLLTRLLSQLLNAGHTHVVVSTSPSQYPLLSSFVERTVDAWIAAGSADFTVDVFSNPAHGRGPLPALAEAVSGHVSQEYVLALADIMFSANPFTSAASKDSDGQLVVGPYEAGRSGIVLTHAAFVSRLLYRWPAQSGPTGEAALNWTGAARFGADVASEIVAFASGADGQPLEAAFNSVLSRGYALSYAETGRFVNVNVFEDLAVCQAILESQSVADETPRSPRATERSLGHESAECAPHRCL
jgi:NDP-sugar pyrophosphorylase family protein